VKQAIGGSITAPALGRDEWWERSHSRGDTIPCRLDGAYYAAYYREPRRSSALFGRGRRFNVTQTQQVHWFYP
jgi:hypothetical protein